MHVFNQRPVPPLVVASNRLPIRRDGHGGQRRSDGGLVRALEPATTAASGTWIGAWPAEAPLPSWPHRAPFGIQPVRLHPEAEEEPYLAYANRVLWPWLHGEKARVESDPRWWKAYQEVNRRFAKAIALYAPPESMAWVHDYHLLLVPKMLRELRPDLRIGFFLHTPFPVDLAGIPHSEFERLAEGAMGADVVGFQTTADRGHFRQAVAGPTPSGRTEPARLAWEGRDVALLDCPASIDAAHLLSFSKREAIRQRVGTLRAELGPERRIVLGVDRLDYTKALPTRLRAYEQLLERGAVTVDDTVFVQVAVPSRSDVPAYAAERAEVERLARRINQRFSRGRTAPGDRAVVLHLESVGLEELVALYLAAEVMAVTPRRDGMNLVAKEFCAVRSDARGVLVLSSGAGASWELDGAITPASQSAGDVADAIEEALHLDEVDAAGRMTRMHRHVHLVDAAWWADRFLGGLAAA